MGKKGGWIAAIRKVFLGCPDKPAIESGERGTKEKKKKEKGPGKPKYGKTKSFIPRFREPSSIEEILVEAEREKNLFLQPPTSHEIPKTPVPEPSGVSSSSAPPPPASTEIPKTPVLEPPDVSSSSILPRVVSPRASSNRAISPRGNSQRSAASPRITSPKVDSVRATSSRGLNNQKEISCHPEPASENQHAAATKIQAVYRGYMARRSFRALRGLVRLHGVMRGNNAKRQTMNAMRYMQLSVRVQSQIRSRRVEMFESKAPIQAPFRTDKDVESNLGKWSLASEVAGKQEMWDDSRITKEERDARLQRRMDALINKERAKAYAYSNQKSFARSASKMASTDRRSDGFPWWWSRLENHLPLSNNMEDRSLKSFHMTPPRSSTRSFKFDHFDASTPRSSRSSVVALSRRALTPPSGRILSGGSSSKYLRPRSGVSGSPFNNGAAAKDDDGSLLSCPPFSVPHYMAPTISMKAKARPNSTPRERSPGTPRSEASRRLSFPLTPSSRKDTGSQAMFDTNSIGNLSTIDSPASVSNTGVGRKPFNRFV